MKQTMGVRRWVLRVSGVLALAATPLRAQESNVVRIDLPTGRSYPLTTTAAITRVSIATPEVADVVVISEREVVINAKATGETDAILWQANGTRLHYRVSVHSPSDRMQIALSVKFAEVRKDALREIDVSGRYQDAKGTVRAGTGIFRSDDVIDSLGNVLIPGAGKFLSLLSNFDTKNFLAFIELQQRSGRARILAEPTLIAANKEEASFLAGGELPIPVVQGGGGGDASSQRVTIEYREFGVRLNFLGEIISDSLIKLRVRPEVSNLDFGNAVVISGFRIPALRTRRIESTLDVRQNESLIISGFFNSEEEKVKRGIPLLMDIPILGQLFSSTSFQKNESELIVIVTPVVINPLRPRPRDVLEFLPDTTLPARDAIKKRLPPDSRKSGDRP